MANYTALMRGNKAGPVISAGKGKDSRIIEVIESGDMPRGGGRVSGTNSPCSAVDRPRGQIRRRRSDRDAR